MAPRETRSITIDRHPPERGPQSVILPSVCCTCCCCCSCCLSTVGAIAGGVIAVKGSDAAPVGARKRLALLIGLTMAPAVVLDIVLGFPLLATFVVLPGSMVAAGLLAWFAYAAGLFEDPDKSERAIVERFIAYTVAGTVVGLLLLIPIVGLFLA